MRNFIATPLTVENFTATGRVVTVCKKMLLKWKNAMSIFLLMAFLFSSTASAQCPYPGRPVVNGNPSEWPTILTSNGNGTVLSLRKSDVMNGGNTDDVFTGGSADVSLLSGWHWTMSSANDKTDMGNVGAALICDTLYVFADRYAVNGDAKIGIWIFKSPVSLNPNGSFNGVHSEGDILITSLFTQGGGVSTPTIFTWTGGALNSGVIGAFGSLAAVNSAAFPVPVSPGWVYPGSKGGVAGQYAIGAFFEAKIAVSALGGIGIDPCFATVLFETGVSQGTTSSLSDLAVTTFSSLPTPNFTNTTACLGQPTVFTNTSTNASTYVWDFGDGSPNSTTTSPSHTYATAGTFNVKLVATGTAGCKDSVTKAVTVNAAAPCSITGNDNVCPGTTNTYTGSAGNDTYAWSIIAGTASISGSSSGQTVSIIAPATCSNYTIQLITTKNGCSTTCSQIFHAVDNTPPVITCPSAATVTCTANLPAAFTTIASFIAGGGTASDNCTATSSLSISHTDGTITGDINCQYSFVRTYTISDLCGNSSQCTQTLSVHYSGGLTPPANATATVSCPAQATDPGAPASIIDACGRTVSAVFIAEEQTPNPVVCNGTIVYRYRYTACDGTTTADWTKTYTISGVTAPVFANCGQTISLGNNPSTLPTCANYATYGGAVTASNQCGPVQVSCSAGTVITSGCNKSQVFTFTATGCGLTSTCTRTYTWSVTCAHIFPTSTSCCNYVSGNSPVLEKLCYTPRNNAVFNAIPGVMFYYGTIIAPGANFTLDVKQSNSNANFNLLDVQNLANIHLFTETCGNVTFTGSLTNNNHDAHFVVTGATPGATYIVSVKYQVKSMEGSICTGNPTVTYTYNSYLNNVIVSGQTGAIPAVANCSDNTPLPPACTVAPENNNLIVSRPGLDNAVTIENDGVIVTAYPNPFDDNIRFSISSDISGQAILEIYNMLGVKVQTIYKGFVFAGKGQTINYQVPNIYRTTLIYKLRVGNKTVSGKLINVK